MIELLHTISTSLVTDFPQNESTIYDNTNTSDIMTNISHGGSSTSITSTTATSTTTITSFLGANDLFDGNTNVSNHIRQVFFANSGGINNSFESMLSGVDIGNETATTTAPYLFNRNGTVVKEFIFDRTDVRIIFITLYSLVFFCCFFGEYLLFYLIDFFSLSGFYYYYVKQKIIQKGVSFIFD